MTEFDFEGNDITPEVLAIVGLIKKPTDPVVILGGGEIDSALTIKAHRFSGSAQQKIEAAGGKAIQIPLGETA